MEKATLDALMDNAPNASELLRLQSNHSELLLHRQTLQKQLAFKSDELNKYQQALLECKAALARAETPKETQ